MTMESFCELLLLTRAHYQAWLSAGYARVDVSPQESEVSSEKGCLPVGQSFQLFGAVDALISFELTESSFRFLQIVIIYVNINAVR